MGAAARKRGCGTDHDRRSSPASPPPQVFRELRPSARSRLRAPAAAGGAWGSMVDETRPSAKGGSERVLNQEEIDALLGFSLADVSFNDNSGIRAIIDSAMVSYERLPMLEIVFDRLVRLLTTSLAQFHLRQRRSLARPHHVGAFRRLHQLDSAAGHPLGVQGRAMGQFRAAHGQFQPDLFDDRRAARRTARVRHRARRRPALHHDRDQPRQAHDRGDPRRRRARLQAAVAGRVQHRPYRDQSALRRDHAARQCRDPGAVCASTWKIAAATPNCCCPMRPSSRSATFCCRCSWARNSAATRSGKSISRPRSARPKSASMPCSTRRSCRCGR